MRIWKDEIIPWAEVRGIKIRYTKHKNLKPSKSKELQRKKNNRK